MTGTARRVLALTRAEGLLLRRDTVAMLSVVGVPVVGALVLVAVGGDGEAAARSISVLVGVLLLFVVYYNLLIAYVARREELVLTRLRTGEAADGEILTATALPAVLTALGQVVLLVAVAALFLDLPLPANAPLLLVAVVLGGVVLTALALLTAPFTRSTVSTQLTSLPVMSVCIIGAGIVVPLELLPDAVAEVGRYLPLTPVLELVQLGWLGTTQPGGAAGDLAATTREALVPLAVAAAWGVLGVVAARHLFRWEPRG